MLSWRNIRLIFLREVRDQLRDRRTLFMVAVLPLLLYPAMGIGMMQLNVLFREESRTVVILGADQLPADPPLVAGDRFDARWFPGKSDPNRLVVVTDLPEEGDGSKGANPRLLAQARQIRDALRTDRRRAGALFGKSEIEVLILIPEGLASRLAAVEQALREERADAAPALDYPRPEIIFNKADEKSQISYGRVQDVLENWEAAIRDGWLKLAHLDARLTHPVLGEPVNVALDEQLAAGVWGRLFPALLVIMSVTGAFYPAIDLVAGEKERGTMETLLICPASRSEIVLGKFFTVMTFSCATALLNLASMGFTGRHIAAMAPAGGIGASGPVSFPPLGALLWLVALLLPLSALFSALCLALATFARSSKEGQYYLTPLLMVTLGLTVFCLSPGVELNPRYALMPVVGVALLLKGLLLSPLQSISLYGYIPAVLISSLGYCALALWWAIDQFQREEVLFREAERFDLRLWIRHLLRDKEPCPSFSEAAFCFVLIMLLQFFSLRYLQQRLWGAGSGDRPQLLMQLLLVQQLAIIASPALMMGLMLTTSLRATFSIHWPQARFLAAALVLPFAIHPLSYEALARLRWLLGDLSPQMVRELAFLSDPNQPLWMVLLAAALAPAFCEEVAFRGFILRGFNRDGRALLAIILSSLAFGVMHMIPQQVFNATLIGLVLGALTLRSGSLAPAMMFHFINNSLSVVHGRLSVRWHGKLPENPFVAFDPDGAARYSWLTLALCLLVVIPLVRWLFRPFFARQFVAGTITSDPAAPILATPQVAPKGV
ncbi:MAG: ABC transporter permease subunit/CPBP intramembrane protease [Planctomycetaceae bacterium]